MSILLRQFLAVLVVTIVSTSLAISAGQAAMAFECDITLAGTGSDMHPAASSQSASGHEHPAAAANGDGHRYEEHGDAPGDPDATHCKAHACPSNALPAFQDIMPAVAAGQALGVIRTDSLVELTAPEGLRRPPRG